MTMWLAFCELFGKQQCCGFNPHDVMCVCKRGRR